MEKRRRATIPSQVNSDTLDIQEPVPYTKVEQSVVVICRFPATLSLVGAVSGKQYRWENAGAKVAVDARDVPELLKKRMGQSACCGGTQNTSPLFEVI